MSISKQVGGRTDWKSPDARLIKHLSQHDENEWWWGEQAARIACAVVIASLLSAMPTPYDTYVVSPIIKIIIYCYKSNPIILLQSHKTTEFFTMLLNLLTTYN